MSQPHQIIVPQPRPFHGGNFVLPKEPQPVHKDFAVPWVSLIETVQTAEQLFLGKIFGIGIEKSVLKEQNLKNGTFNNYNIHDYSRNYLPDAEPNGRGGYNKTDRWDGYMSTSLPGMPVMCYLKLKGGTYTDTQGQQLTFPDIIFETVVITLSMGKDIKKTKIMGRNTGSVKEYNGQSDWTIEIKAVITADAPVNEFVSKYDQTGRYPIDNMHQIWQMLQAPIAIPVECWYLNLFDINYIVIEDRVRINQIEGEYSMQRLSIPALSDHPLVIKFANG